MADDIVVICTANVARSPLLALRLQQEADQRCGVDALQVGSGGTHATFGDPAAEGSRAVAASWGADLDDHQARPLPHLDLRAAALVVVMTRVHRREIVQHAPDMASRTVLLRAAAQVATQHGPPDRQANLQPRAQLEAGTDWLVTQEPRRRGRRLDVPDPIGAGQDTYDELGREFVAAATTLGEVLFGPLER